MAMRYYSGHSGVKSDMYFLMEEQRTRPDAVNSGSSIQVPAIKITEIPGIMKKIGWKKSAAFMNRWLTSSAWKCPESWKDGKGLPPELFIPDQHCDDKTITMSWLMGYPAAQKAIADLLGKACSPAAMRITAHRLKKLGWNGDTTYTFGRKNIIGRPSMSARELEQYYQNNFISVGGNAAQHFMFDTLDDIYGSLGTYNLKVAVFGTAFRGTDGKRYLEATWAGVYVKDFYDFNNDGGYDQWLGFWSDAGIVTRSGAAMTGIQGMNVYTGKKFNKVSLIHNSDFLNYREKTGKGGDFIVFSDVYWTKISGTYQLPWEE